MIKTLKNTGLGLLVCGSLLVTASEADAASAAIVVTNVGLVSFPTVPTAPITATQFVFANPNASNAQVTLYDLSTNQTTNVIAAYTNTATTLSNLVTHVTNYYGATNNFTNVVIVDNTNNAVAASTNINTGFLTVEIPANNTVVVSSGIYHIANGLWITNAGTSNVSATVVYH